ncbi:hypothetical protein [Roseixanthobacter pseudopolyaromaticivorans]|uniref:hypothetical protein n=1 Tax=Xanthobacteraceae TaxID=335928 RepID=UPI0037265C95
MTTNTNSPALAIPQPAGDREAGSLNGPASRANSADAGEAVTWMRWYDQRPTDHKAQYRWRVSPRKILGLTMQPEWTCRLRCVGMGYGDNEWWPDGSDWDGYRRSIDHSLEWRLAKDCETEPTFHGLELLPNPFTGLAPKVVTLGRWIGSPVWEAQWIGIESYLVKSLGWTDAAKMRDAWNRRALPSPPNRGEK